MTDKQDLPPLPGVYADLVEALRDMLSGWQYIRTTHGDLYGVGWDRAENKAVAALEAIRSHEAERGAQEHAVAAFDVAVSEELPLVSHVHYDSHEICKHFAGEVRKRLLAAEASNPVQAEAPSDSTLKLAETILADCGHSTAISTLLRDRVAGRIERHLVTPPTASPVGERPEFAGWQKRVKFSDVPGAVPQWQQCGSHEAASVDTRHPAFEYRKVYTSPQPDQSAYIAELERRLGECEGALETQTKVYDGKPQEVQDPLFGFNRDELVDVKNELSIFGHGWAMGKAHEFISAALLTARTRGEGA